jgi:hypothetical protein
MALGSNHAERSRKRDLLTQIRLSLVGAYPELTAEEACQATKGYHRYSVAMLERVNSECYNLYKQRKGK